MHYHLSMKITTEENSSAVLQCLREIAARAAENLPEDSTIDNVLATAADDADPTPSVLLEPGAAVRATVIIRGIQQDLGLVEVTEVREREDAADRITLRAE